MTDVRNPRPLEPGQSSGEPCEARAVVGVAAKDMTDEELKATLRMLGHLDCDDSALVAEGARRGWWQ